MEENELHNLSYDELVKYKEDLLKEEDSSPKILDKLLPEKERLIDKYTKIDDLLRALINRVDILIDKIEISNKLLLAQYYQEAADGTIVQKAPMEIDTSILESIGGGEDYTTEIVNLPNMVISGKQEVFNITGSGYLIEIMFKSSTSTTDNKDYSVRIKADTKNIYEDSFTNFESRNHFETDMTCYEDTRADYPYYYLQFKNISFKDNIIIEVYESSATFTQIYVKYLQRA